MIFGWIHEVFPHVCNLNTLRCPFSPEGARRWRQRAHEMGDVVRNVDGQRGNLRLDGLDRWFRHVPWLLFVIGQRCERDLYTCAGKSEATPNKKRLKWLHLNEWCMFLNKCKQFRVRATMLLTKSGNRQTHEPPAWLGEHGGSSAAQIGALNFRFKQFKYGSPPWSLCDRTCWPLIYI